MIEVLAIFIFFVVLGIVKLIRTNKELTRAMRQNEKKPGTNDEISGIGN